MAMPPDRAPPDWASLAACPVPWLPTAEEAASTSARPFVLATRLASYRNFAGTPFPISASSPDCEALARRASEYASRRGAVPSVRLADIGLPVLRMLRERHLLPEPPVPLAGKKGVKHLALGPGDRSFAWINEVEQLTWLQFLPGLLPGRAFEAAYLPPPAEPGHPWAESARYGFLASDPARAGSGASFHLLVHLPALALARRLGQVHGGLAALGLGFTPVTRMAIPGGADSARFWISGRGGMGRSAGEAYRRFLEDVEPLLGWEREAQRDCLERHRKRLEERVRNSLELLRQAPALGLRDFDLADSWIRLGAYLGLLDTGILAPLEGLRPRTHSGHLEVIAGATLSKVEEDMARANVVRLSLERMVGPS
jgi:protein-arginine kinase